MGSEQELIPAIRRISRRSATVEEAIHGVEAALKAEIGDATLLVQPEGDTLSPFSIHAVSSFLNSRAFPFRGVYTASSRAGRLVVCLAAFSAPGKIFQELTNQISAELGVLSVRLQGKVA